MQTINHWQLQRGGIRCSDMRLCVGVQALRTLDSMGSCETFVVCEGVCAWFNIVVQDNLRSVKRSFVCITFSKLCCCSFLSWVHNKVLVIRIYESWRASRAQRGYIIKNNQLAALKKQKARIDESIKKVEHERKSLVSTNCNFILQQQSHPCDL